MLDLSDMFAAFPTLESERCILRATLPEDAEAIFHMMSDPRVTQYIGQQPMSSLDKAVERVQKLRALFEEQSAISWVIASRTEQQFIGTCVIWNIDPPNFRAEIGYIIAPEFWGKGLMTEVAAAMLNFGFTTMRLHSMEAQIEAENIASRRVLEKLGFVQEGFFCEYYYDPIEERFTDKGVFSLLEPIWTNRAKRL